MLANVYTSTTQCSPILVVIPKTTHPSSKALHDKAITVRVKSAVSFEPRATSQNECLLYTSEDTKKLIAHSSQPILPTTTL